MNASRVISAVKRALVGSGIEAFTGGEWPSECKDALEFVATPAAPSVPTVWLGDNGPLELICTTRLTVLGGSLVIAIEQRRFLAEVDLSAFGQLPWGSTLAGSFALRVVRFSRELMEIPRGVSHNCSRLIDVNSGECYSMTMINQQAFYGCWKLRELIIPDGCTVVGASGSGVGSLDLRGSKATSVLADNCYHMGKFFLPNRVACVLGMLYCPALSHLSLRIWPRGNAWGWARNVRLKEMRLSSMRAAPLSDGAGACLSRAHVFADVGSVGERQARPALPC
jgi:hypothetical protein